MENKDRTRHYLVIDLKSFYASVECVERGLDPMTTNLVVADPTRSERTICLAVSPSMKALGVKNRCRVFQIPKGIEYIMAPPRMRKYLEYSAAIYGIYLKYISKDDIHCENRPMEPLRLFFQSGIWTFLRADLRRVVESARARKSGLRRSRRKLDDCF